MTSQSPFSPNPLHKCLIIAEVAQAHDGSLGTAHAYIDAIARAGADAVKFQTHIASAESTQSEPWRVHFSPQDRTRYDYWKRMEFSAEQWAGLKRHAEEQNLLFLSSPFSHEAFMLLQSLGVSTWKIASGEVTNDALLNDIIATDDPIILSSGMSTTAELDAAVNRIKSHGNELTLLQCTSLYPTPPEKVGLRSISEFRVRYNCPVGLSDHSGTIFPAIAATAIGIDVLEVHVAFSREVFGPDVIASVTTQELATLVQGVHFIESAMSVTPTKDLLAQELSSVRAVFTRSIVSARDIPAGSLLTEADLALRKPGTGLPAKRLPQLIGRRVIKHIPSGTLISENDIAN